MRVDTPTLFVTPRSYLRLTTDYTLRIWANESARSSYGKIRKTSSGRRGASETACAWRHHYPVRYVSTVRRTAINFFLSEVHPVREHVPVRVGGRGRGGVNGGAGMGWWGPTILPNPVLLFLTKTYC